MGKSFGGTQALPFISGSNKDPFYFGPNNICGVSGGKMVITPTHILRVNVPIATKGERTVSRYHYAVSDSNQSLKAGWSSKRCLLRFQTTSLWQIEEVMATEYLECFPMTF